MSDEVLLVIIMTVVVLAGIVITSLVIIGILILKRRGYLTKSGWCTKRSKFPH